MLVKTIFFCGFFLEYRVGVRYQYSALMMVLERNCIPIIYLSRCLLCYLNMSVGSTSHADMLDVNIIYV